MPTDLHHNILVESVLKTQVVSGAAGEVAVTKIDRQGFESLEFIAALGESGDTLSGSLKLDFILKEGELNDGSDLAPVTDETVVLGATPDSNGVVITVDADGKDGKIYSVGYVGSKRYTALVPRKTGTHTNGTPLAIVAVKGGAHKRSTL
jgi:hypothetical protein